MQDLPENADEQLHQAIALAEEEAQRFNHNYIGTEHLLLGLLRVEDGVPFRALTALGVEIAKVRSAIEFIIGRGDRPLPGEIGLTPRSKTVLALAADEAQLMHDERIGPEHLLLGLIREGEGIAAGVLESLGVNLDRARSTVLHTLGRAPEPGAAGGDLQANAGVAAARIRDPLQSVLADVRRAKKGAAATEQYDLASEIYGVELRLQRVLENQVGAGQISAAPESWPQSQPLDEALRAIGRAKDTAIQQRRYELAAEARHVEILLTEFIVKFRS